MSKDIDELTALNRDYVASVQNCDVKRFDEILAQDFYCTNPDKSLVDRAALSQADRRAGDDPKSDRRRRQDPRARRFRHHPRPHQLHDGGWSAGPWALHRLLGEAERPWLAVSAHVSRSQRHSGREVNPTAVDPGSGAADAHPYDTHASNMITLRTVLPAFMRQSPR